MKKAFLFMCLFPFTLLVNAQQLSSQFFDIKIIEAKELVYNDDGSGAHQDLAIWRAKPPSGYYTLGHAATPYKNIDKNNGKGYPVVIALKPKSGYESLLKKPTDYDWIWNDSGSGAHKSVSTWRMKCPSGYIALGDVSIGHQKDKPNDSSCRCIKKTAVDRKTRETVHLTKPAKVRSMSNAEDNEMKALWTDSGSGGTHDGSIWLMECNSKPSTNQVFLVPGTFVSNKSHDAPGIDVYALALNFPNEDMMSKDAEPAEKLILSGERLPSKAEIKASENLETYTVPFFAIYDSQYPSQLKQFQDSPEYTVKRYTYYHPIDLFTVTSRTTKEYSVTTGTSTEENYSNTFGILFGISATVGAEGGLPGGAATASASVTLSSEVSFSHTWGGSTTEYKQETFTYPQTINTGCTGALFQTKSRYQIFRADGSQVDGDMEVGANEFYQDEWCPNSNNNNSSSGKSILTHNSKIVLRAHNDKYLSARIDKDDSPVRATATEVKNWEQFTVIDKGNGKIALRAHNDKYLSARTDADNSPVRATASVVKNWEQFTVVDKGNGKIALKAHNGKYLSARTDADNSPVRATASVVKNWEQFTVKKR